MKYENEITVEIDISLDELKNILKNNHFKVVDDYYINDIYMLDKNYIEEKDYLEKLKHCVLIRNIIADNENKVILTYKYKEYNDKKEIINQGKVDCYILSINEGLNLLNAIGYEELIRINDHIIVYANEEDELAIQLVNDKHIYIEIEEVCNNINKKYSNIKEMKNVLSKYQIPIKDNNYFVKKAEIEIKEQTNG